MSCDGSFDKKECGGRINKKLPACISRDHESEFLIIFQILLKELCRFSEICVYSVRKLMVCWGNDADVVLRVHQVLRNGLCAKLLCWSGMFGWKPCVSKESDQPCLGALSSFSPAKVVFGGAVLCLSSVESAWANLSILRNKISKYEQARECAQTHGRHARKKTPPAARSGTAGGGGSAILARRATSGQRGRYPPVVINRSGGGASGMCCET